MEISIAIEVFCLFVAHFSEVRSITGQLVALMIYKFKKGPAPWMNPHSDCLSFFPVVYGQYCFSRNFIIARCVTWKRVNILQFFLLYH